jgi:hypothetical protein
MKATIVTTITTYLDIETLETTHEVDVQTNDPLPHNVVVAAATGGCRSALAALKKSRDAAAPKIAKKED